MGLELVNNERQSQHLTVHFTTTDMVTGKVSAVDGMKKKFFGLLENQRIMSIQNKDGKLCGTIEIKSCSKNHMPTKTAMTHCVYPLKDAVKGKRREDLTEADYNNKVTHWTNLFDGERKCTDENEKNEWRMNRLAFHHLLVEELRKKNHKAPHLIHPRTHNEQAEAYAIGNGLPKWTPESHAHILATMVTNKLGEKNYILAPGFLKKSVQKALYDQNYREDYKELVEQTLRHHFIKRRRELEGISAPSKQEKKLASQNDKWQKKYTKLENNCKRLVFENVNLKRKIKGKSPLEDPAKTSSWQHGHSGTCCVCSSESSSGSRNLIRILPCKHFYCNACLVPQMNNNTMDCSHCTLDALKDNGVDIIEHASKWNKARIEKEQWDREQRNAEEQRNVSKKRPLDTISPEQQRRMKRLRAAEARCG